MKNEDFTIEDAVTTVQTLNPPEMFKYQKEIAGLTKCPPRAIFPPFDHGYRFHHMPNHINNELPPCKINPSRLEGKSDKECCSLYALSFYRSAIELKKCAQVGVNNSPKFLKRLGDHYIEATLGPSAGRQVNLSSNGHFDLHEYASFNLSTSIVATTKI